ncbi:hypothetical protein EVAR_48326_1 [Eumeta japonica]|uniref:Uncharacterized protein n=1 Tax=Eumeta variegata TaxID=151549 RepID=A0A4C1YQD0_EUMVA|nr:hypothetical protein EVAR_48326_1 [Eumeta japonica]
MNPLRRRNFKSNRQKSLRKIALSKTTAEPFRSFQILNAYQHSLCQKLQQETSTLRSRRIVGRVGVMDGRDKAGPRPRPRHRPGARPAPPAPASSTDEGDKALYTDTQYSEIG